mgnify:CR=1 FL=1
MIEIPINLNSMSMRERLVTAQALRVAIETMSKVPSPYTEVSNIMDMEYVGEHYFGDVWEITALMVEGQKEVQRRMHPEVE